MYKRKKETASIVICSMVATTLFMSGVVYQAAETGTRIQYASAATSSAVTVSASVDATISCSTNAAATAFGTLTTGAVATGDTNTSTTMSCANSSGGCTLYVKDAGGGGNPGLWNSSASYLIPSVSSTLVAGTEGYGVNATTTAGGGGGSFTIAAHYKLGSDTATTTVGGMLTTNQSLATVNSTSSQREVVVRHKAAIAGGTSAGSYADTITYECTAN